MKDEIRKIIEKHLPAEVGTALKGQLEELETLKAEKVQDEQISRILNKRVEKLESDNTKFKSLEKWESELKIKDNELSVLEHGMELEGLKKDLECQKEITKQIISFNYNIFRNIQIRKHITGMTGPHSVSHDETIDEE